MHCKSKDIELNQDELDEMANWILNVMEDPNWNHNPTAELICQTRTIREKAVKTKKPASVDEKYEQDMSACSWPTTVHSSRQLCRLPRICQPPSEAADGTGTARRSQLDQRYGKPHASNPKKRRKEPAMPSAPSASQLLLEKLGSFSRNYRE